MADRKAFWAAQQAAPAGKAAVGTSAMLLPATYTFPTLSAAHTASALKARDVPADAMRPADRSQAISMVKPSALMISTPPATPEHAYAVADDNRHQLGSHMSHDMLAPAAPSKPGADSRIGPLAEQPPAAADNCIPSVITVQSAVICAQDRLRRLSDSEKAVCVVLPLEDDVDIDVEGLVDLPGELGAGCATDAAVKHNFVGQVQAGNGCHWLCMLLAWVSL